MADVALEGARLLLLSWRDHIGREPGSRKLAAPSQHLLARHLRNFSNCLEPRDISLRCNVGGGLGDVRGIEGTMQPSFDANFWRKRAEKARATAEVMTATAAKRDMQLIAERTARRRVTRPSA